MKKVILFGATGRLGQELAKELLRQGYELTVVARNDSKAKSIAHITTKYIIADVCKKDALKNICDSQEIVIST